MPSMKFSMGSDQNVVHNLVHHPKKNASYVTSPHLAPARVLCREFGPEAQTGWLPLILHLMGDDLNFPMAYLSVDKGVYERKSMLSQSELNSRTPDQESFSHSLFLVKTFHDLSKFFVTHSELNFGRYILSHSKGHGFQNFLEAQPLPLLLPKINV